MVQTGRLNPLVISLVILLAGGLSSCSNRSKEILSEKELIEITSEMRIAGAMFDTGQGRQTGFSSKEEAQMGILRKHGVSTDQYRKTIEWYGENLDKLDKVNSGVTKNIEKRIAKIDPEAERRVNDQNNIWPYADHLIMRPGMMADGISFSLTEPAIEKGGYAELKMRTSDPETAMSVMVGVDYDDGSMSYTGRTASGFPQIKIRVQSDTARKVRRLFGYVRPMNKLVKTVTFDSITLVKIPYDSTEYYRISSQTVLDRKRPKASEKDSVHSDSAKLESDSTKLNQDSVALKTEPVEKRASRRKAKSRGNVMSAGHD